MFLLLFVIGSVLMSFCVLHSTVAHSIFSCRNWGIYCRYGRYFDV